VVHATPVSRPWRGAAAVAAAHAVLVMVLCWDMVLLGHVPYVRDVLFLYVPDFAFLATSLAQRVWPFWNPLIDGGRPVLFAYLPDVALVGLLGPLGAARVEVPLHLWWGAAGASFLARTRGHEFTPVWAAGAFYAASGYVLSCGNVFPLLQAAAWAPWVIAAGLRVARQDGWRPVVALATCAALQVGSLAAELIVQTGVLLLVLVAGRTTIRGWGRLAAAGVLAAALAAPVLLGARAMAVGTGREAGFSRAVTLSWSIHPAELPALVLPRYFGEMHTFSDAGYWGQGLFENGYPYFLSTYVGLAVAILAVAGASRRLALVALAGVAVALGAHGPLGPVVAAALEALHVRVPAKFLFTTVIAVVLMAAEGLERSRSGRRGAWILVPGLALCLIGLLLRGWPDAVATGLGGWTSLFRDPRAQLVVRTGWPGDFLGAGLLAAAAGLALWRGGRLAALAAAAAVADLLIAGAPLDPTVPPSFYSLRPPLQAVIDQARSEGTFRWFSYGAALTTGLEWRADVVARNRDVALFEIEMQSLTPRTQELAGLEGAFDEDRTSFAPLGSTLTADERRPSRFREIHPRLRAANVRWVLGYEPLPEDLVRLRASAAQPEVRQPLNVYEILDPWPRAYWVPTEEAAEGGPPAGMQAVVSYERVDPHTVRLRATTPPGFIVVRDGYDAGWHARRDGEEVPLRRVPVHGWALPTAGGTQTIEARFEPSWLFPSLVLAGAGLAAAGALAVRPSRAAPTEARPGPDPA
jgi:hypothetical protein